MEREELLRHLEKVRDYNRYIEDRKESLMVLEAEAAFSTIELNRALIGCIVHFGSNKAFNTRNIR